MSEPLTPAMRARGAGAYAALRPREDEGRALSAWQRWEMDSLGARQAAPAAAAAKPVFASEPGTPAPAPDHLERERLRLEAMRAAAAQGQREGWAEGHALGLAQGHTAGLAAGLAAASAHAEQLRALVQALPEALRRADGEIADAVLGLALDIARQVVHRSLRADPGYLLPLVQDLLHAEPALQGTPRLLLHPDDVALVKNALGDELQNAGWQLRADDTLSRGGCRVLADNGERDATVPTRWARVAAALGRDIEGEGHAD